MARYPAAVWRPLSINYTERATAKRRVILHTSASATATSLHGWFSNPSAGASSHFHVDQYGRVEQYIDTDHISWASGEGNPDSISVETQGDGTAPWTPAQVAALVALLRWAHDVHGVPLTMMTSSKAGTSGVGWHRLGVDGEFPALPSILAGRGQRGGGESWSRARGKACPGDARIQQVPGIISAATKPPTPPTAKDAPMPDLLTLDEWSADVDGRQIVWGIHGPQCVDLAKDYAIRVHGAPPGAYGHGKDMARGLSRLDGWTYSGPNGNARRGMIVSGLPEAPWHEDYGHVWVLLEVHADGSWTIKDQNPHPAATRRIIPSAIAGMVMPPARPGALSAAQAPSPSKVHTVKAGETLGKIAAAYGTTVEHLRAWNSIRDINVIQAGERLMVSEPRPRYVITWDTLNIFTGPGTGYARINAEPLLKGLPLVGTGRTADGWVELSTPYMDLRGQTGWVWGAGVSKVGA